MTRDELIAKRARLIEQRDAAQETVDRLKPYAPEPPDDPNVIRSMSARHAFLVEQLNQARSEVFRLSLEISGIDGLLSADT